MPLTRKYVELYGGEIWAESHPIEQNPNGHGTTIFIKLKPASKDDSKI